MKKSRNSKLKINKKCFELQVLGDWDRLRLASLLDLFANKKILVIGDVGIDRYVMGSVDRISPEAPVPIVAVEKIFDKLGLAANVAENIEVLGGDAQLLGVVGADRAADDFKKNLNTVGVDTALLVVDRTRSTILKERIVSDRQQLLRVDYESVHPLTDSLSQQLLKTIAAQLPKCDAVILQDYAKGMISLKLAHQVFALAKKAKKIVAVDPNSKTDVGFYEGAWVLTPNTKEAEALSKIKIHDEASLCEAGKIILKATRAQHVIITRGKDGMAIFSARSSCVQLIPTYAKEVYDVSGAGDTVISVLTLALSAGASVEEAVILGNLAAGIEVGKRGTATVSCDEIRSVL